MNIHLEHFRGSILLETLISIVILGLIVVGSFFSYSYVYQRIHFQREQRKALGVLQGWMEKAISSIDPDNNPLDFSNMPNSLNMSLNSKENSLIAEFKEEILDPNNSIGSNIAFIEPNIFRPIYKGNEFESIVKIKLSITLSNNEDTNWGGYGLPITLCTNIYIDPNT